MITFVLVRKQRIYTAPSGNDLVLDLILSKNIVGLPYITEVVTQIMSSFVPGGLFERDL